jgi:hypothetical protein
MRMRQTIGAVMAALLVLASPLPAMCGQCQFASAKSNCHASRIQGPASPTAAPEMASEHCQHPSQHSSHHVGQNWAIFQAGPAVPHLASTRLCQDRPCQGLLDASARTDRANSTRVPLTLRLAALAEASGDYELVSQETLRSPIGALPPNPPANPRLSVSLRI